MYFLIFILLMFSNACYADPWSSALTPSYEFFKEKSRMQKAVEQRIEQTLQEGVPHYKTYESRDIVERDASGSKHHSSVPISTE